jgi:hypothetical protein
MKSQHPKEFARHGGQTEQGSKQIPISQISK